MKMIRLKNGSEVQSNLVAATMLTLKSLLAKSPMEFYDLVMLCRDHSYQVFGEDTLDRLKATALVLQNGLPHQCIQDIVLSAVIGDDLEMTLGSPI